MKYILFILAFIIIGSCNGQSEKHSLKIAVIDEQGTGLPEAEVKFTGNDTTILSTTDFDGNLQIRNILSGQYQVCISSVGYYKLQDYQIQIDDTERLVFEMKSGIELDSIEIQWEGGWVTLENEDGKVISVKSKK